MRAIDRKIAEFLESEHVSVLTLGFQSGVLHSSSMHFAFDSGWSTFYFVAKKGSEKLKVLTESGSCQASLVVGFDEKTMVTIQLRGRCGVVEDKDIEVAGKAFADKFNGAKPDENHLFISFISNWWRYSELKSNPKVFISSED